jgi:hypothetical protein
MPFLTLGQAAKESGKQKSTLLDAIRAGRLSATRDDKNQWQIDPAELFRVYPAQPQTEREATQPNTEETPAEIARMLMKERDERERERRRLESTIDDLKTDRDHWRQQATALLTHQPEQPAAPTRKEGRGWLWLGLLLIVVASSGAALFGYWLTMQQGGSL